jgi:hypothetical protein
MPYKCFAYEVSTPCLRLNQKCFMLLFYNGWPDLLFLAPAEWLSHEDPARLRAMVAKLVM